MQEREQTHSSEQKLECKSFKRLVTKLSNTEKKKSFLNFFYSANVVLIHPQHLSKAEDVTS